MQRENGRKHLTKEQLRALLVRKDGAAQKHIPESARWQMAHKAYERRTENAGGRNNSESTDPLEGGRSETDQKKI